MPTVQLVEDAGTRRDDDGARPGTVVGKYVVRAKIGSGGCGTVYAAYDPVLEREVAVKLLARGHAAEGATIDPGWPRLVREARMLAKLSEPQVVTVYDVGETDGQAFLAMEMVDGGDLQDWIARHRSKDATAPLPLRAALDLLEQAGRGLAVAHEAGVVHGDFKPANVLIDQRGRAKVSDFGIARLAEANVEHEPRTLRSDAAQAQTDGSSMRMFTTSQGRPIVGTPAYMAPEQFEGRPASVSSDVYAFCATLYEAIFGALPFRAKTVAELAARKSEGKLAFPSEPRVPKWVTRMLTRGLAVDRAQRFSSMSEVLHELARARSRAGRRWFTLGGAAAGAGVVAIFAAWPASHDRCRDADVEAFPWNAAAATLVRTAFEQAGSTRATTDRVTAQLDAFTEGWHDAYAEACEAAWSDPRLGEQAFACLRRRRAIASALVVAWREPTQAIVDAAPSAVEALPSVDSCVDPEALAGEPDLPEDENLRELAIDAREKIEAAITTARTGDPDEGLAQAQQAYDAVQSLSHPPLLAQAALALGQALEADGDHEAAREKLREAFFGAQRFDDHETAAAASGALVYLVGTRLEEHEEGLLWVEHARVALAKTGGNEATLHSNEAAILERLGRYEEAIARYEQALAEHEPSDAYARGITHLRLGDALRGSNRAEAALEHYDQGMALWRSVLGDDHPRLAVPTIGRASALSKLGRNEEAVEGYRSAIEALQRGFGADHPNVGAAQVNLGISLKNLGRFDEAEVATREALRITIAGYGENHLKVAHRRDALGRLLTAAGRPAEALVEHERALAIFTEGLPPDHPDRILVHTNIGDAHRAHGDLSPAIASYRTAVETAKRRPNDDPLRGDTLAYLGRALVEAGEHDEARTVLQDAITRLQRAEGYDDVLAFAREALAKLR
jgi:tetratricopeptide (TPR) repeat protein